MKTTINEQTVTFEATEAESAVEVIHASLKSGKRSKRSSSFTKSVEDSPHFAIYMKGIAHEIDVAA
jgi:hypothetical protein